MSLILQSISLDSLSEGTAKDYLVKLMSMLEQEKEQVIKQIAAEASAGMASLERVIRKCDHDAAAWSSLGEVQGNADGKVDALVGQVYAYSEVIGVIKLTLNQQLTRKETKTRGKTSKGSEAQHHPSAGEGTPGPRAGRTQGRKAAAKGRGQAGGAQRRS
jgi:hypothetical protein